MYGNKDVPLKLPDKTAHLEKPFHLQINLFFYYYFFIFMIGRRIPSGQEGERINPFLGNQNEIVS